MARQRGLPLGLLLGRGRSSTRGQQARLCGGREARRPRTIRAGEIDAVVATKRRLVEHWPRGRRHSANGRWRSAESEVAAGATGAGHEGLHAEIADGIV